jgi:hypothetical protein
MPRIGTKTDLRGMVERPGTIVKPEMAESAQRLEKGETLSVLSALHQLMADSDLLRSHHELRAALRLAGRKIGKLNFGRRDTPLLKLLRRVLREARAVAAAQKAISSRPR